MGNPTSQAAASPAKAVKKELSNSAESSDSASSADSSLLSAGTAHEHSEQSSEHSEHSEHKREHKPEQEQASGGTKRKRRNTNEELAANRKKGRTKRILKSLIALDPYDTEDAVNVQHEDLWGEHERRHGAPSEVPAAAAAEAAKEREEQDAKFAEREKELDAELPEKYRKFRPKGYHFNIPPTDRPVRVYADGVFDLFHLGHMRQLEQAKKSLPNVTMIVGVPSDKVTHKLKGLTVLSDKQRCETLRHCKWVDEVVPDAPWILNQEFLDKHKIDYVAHDDIPYQSDGQDDVYAFVKKKGMFMTTQRTEGVSTSDIITKIIRDYDLYLMRNFARGVSRKDLNVSWLKKNEIDVKRHVNAFRQSLKANVENTTRDLYADAMGLMQSVLRSRANPDRFKSVYQGGTGSDAHSQNGILNNVKDWMSRHIGDSEAPSLAPSEAPSEAASEAASEAEDSIAPSDNASDVASDSTN